jgi:hypothetical protein
MKTAWKSVLRLHSAAPLLIALLLVTSIALAANGYEISASTFSSGGGRFGAGDYVVDSTIGRAVVGSYSSSPYDLCAGFWCGRGTYKAYLPLVLRSS